MSDNSAPQQTVVVAQPAVSPRWLAVIPVILGVLGTCGVLIGALVTLGAWRAGVDLSLANLDKRMDQAEANQKTYIPVLIGLSKDVTYLAERARREDERADRRDHREGR